jgi:hypothetical protein
MKAQSKIIVTFLLLLLVFASTRGIMCDLECSLSGHTHQHKGAASAAATSSMDMDMAGMPGMSDQEMSPATSASSSQAELSAFSRCSSCTVDYSWADGRKSISQQFAAIAVRTVIHPPAPRATFVSFKAIPSLYLTRHRAPTILRI